MGRLSLLMRVFDIVVRSGSADIVMRPVSLSLLTDESSLKQTHLKRFVDFQQLVPDSLNYNALKENVY